MSLNYLKKDKKFKTNSFSDYSITQLREISDRLWIPQTNIDYMKLGDCDTKKYSTDWCSNLASVNQSNKPYLFQTLKDEPQYNSIDKASKKSQAKTKRKIDYQSNDCCKFIIVNKGIGSLCTKPIYENELCEEHQECKQEKYSKFQNVCDFRMTKYKRKGHRCGKKCEEKYCSYHKKCISTGTFMRSFKVRIVPTVDQIKKLDKFFGCVRKTYNLSLAHTEKENETLLKNELVTANTIGKQYPYILKTPKEIRAFAIEEYVKNEKKKKKSYEKQQESRMRYCTRQVCYKYIIKNHKKSEIIYIVNYIMSLIYTNKTYVVNATNIEDCIQLIDDNKIQLLNEIYDMYNLKPPTKPVLKFQKKKDDQCISIDKRFCGIKNNRFYMHKTIFGKKTIKITGKSLKNRMLLPYLNGKVINHCVKIQKTRTNKYYLIIPYDTEPTKNIPKKEVIACDPGIRTFITAYDPEGMIYKFCDNNSMSKQNTHNKISIIQQRLSRLRRIKKRVIKTPKFYTYKKKIILLGEKLRSKVTNMHYKTIKELIQYKHVFLPHFNTRHMMKSKDLSSITKKSMSSQQHYVFKMRLKHKAELNNCKVHNCSEYGTTKMCSVCFTPHVVGSSEIYTCSNCHSILDRDVNAARNILITHINA